ncbi:hypothetical protein BKA70DRAFT_1400486 [Coprinopsis sp. MPI-PUGE-AT-0042]|nr:hypothetical protein BKA70DRAFT_1400486 [Coprinopsis sp. MPI-PUGE-AT-0042]
MSATPTLPNEILDAIIDSAVESLSTRSFFGPGVETTPELVVLLKNVALTSFHLRERAQRYLFQKIRLRPFLRSEEGPAKYVPSTMDAFLSIFEENPKLLEYPRSLVIMPEDEDRNRGDLHLHFFSVLVPFFTSRLGKLDYFVLQLDWRRQWSTLPEKLQDCIVRCLKENDLKGFEVQGFILPENFVQILPSTLHACRIGLLAVEDDSTLVTNQTGTASPRYLRIDKMPKDRYFGWIQSQADSFFQRLTSLDVGIEDLAGLNALLDRIPYTLSRLSLRYANLSNSLQVLHHDLQQTSCRHMPYLKKLHVYVEPMFCRVVTCPVPAALVVGDHVAAYPSISIFELTVLWWWLPYPDPPISLQNTQGFPEQRFLDRTADGFGRLDDLLADRGTLGALKEVKINLEPKTYGSVRMEQKKIEELQDRIRREAMEVFHRTSSCVNTFSLVTDNAFMR